MPESGARTLVNTLLQLGVTNLFTLSGNQILSIYDAIIDTPLRLIHTRHEAAAVHMADAWGRATENPGVALVTAGPGHCNTISALYVARMAESPLVLLSGHCAQSDIGTGAFQEMDQVAIAAPVCKASWIMTHPNRIREDLEYAFYLARNGRPGPVHISIPSDILGLPLSDSNPDSSKTPVAPSPNKINNTDRSTVLSKLRSAKKPVVLTGPSMSRDRRWSQVQKFSHLANIPALPMDSPRGVNDPWLREASTCLNQADVVLLLNKKLDFSMQFGQAPAFASNCEFIVVDSEINSFTINQNINVKRIDADPELALASLISQLEEPLTSNTTWNEELQLLRNRLPESWKSFQTSSSPLHPMGICSVLDPLIRDHSIFVCDGGEFGQWIQAGLDRTHRLINGPSGAIGGAVSMGLAAKLADPEKTVFVFSGDGAFGFHIMEFDTAIRYNIPVIAIVGNDSRWNAEHVLQMKHYGDTRTIGCELLPSRYDQIVQSLGGFGASVNNMEDLETALRDAIDSKLPACVNVSIEGRAAPVFS